MTSASSVVAVSVDGDDDPNRDAARFDVGAGVGSGDAPCAGQVDGRGERWPADKLFLLVPSCKFKRANAGAWVLVLTRLFLLWRFLLGVGMLLRPLRGSCQVSDMLQRDKGVQTCLHQACTVIFRCG